MLSIRLDALDIWEYLRFIAFPAPRFPDTVSCPGNSWANWRAKYGTTGTHFLTNFQSWARSCIF